MKKTTTVAALAAMTLGAGPALAADLRGPILEPRVIAAAPVAIAGGLYIRGDVGVSYRTMSGLRWASTQNVPDAAAAAAFNSGTAANVRYEGVAALAGLGLGFAWSENFRTDLTLEWQTASDWAFTIERPTVAFAGNRNFHRGSTSATVALANAYWDIGTFWGLTPFVGAGVGLGWFNQYDLTILNAAFGPAGGGPPSGGPRATFVWALHAGLGYRVNENLILEMSYRYLNAGGGFNTGTSACNAPCPEPVYRADIGAHDFRIGMRWTLAELNRSFGFGYQVSGAAAVGAGATWSGGTVVQSGGTFGGGAVVGGGQVIGSGGTVVHGGQVVHGGTVVQGGAISGGGGWVQQGGGWVPVRR